MGVVGVLPADLGPLIGLIREGIVIAGVRELRELRESFLTGLMGPLADERVGDKGEAAGETRDEGREVWILGTEGAGLTIATLWRTLK